jgi:nondiscriminating aspartyl-tRNA synthetase
MHESKRVFVAELSPTSPETVLLRGWVHRLRALSKTTFVILQDCSGSVQCVAATDALKGVPLKLDDAIEVRGKIRPEPRSKTGFEVDILELKILNEAASLLPFNASSDISAVGQEILLDYRPLALRNEAVGDVFRLQAALVEAFREYLRSQRFTEILTSKIVASGTEGGTHLFEIKYFDKVAYLAQSPQFFKEHGVAGLERVFETGHVYRAEPHASSRHLTEYYSLDLELGFIDGPEEIMQLERELLSWVFERINRDFAPVLQRFGQAPLPSMLTVPGWEFGECLERLEREFGRTDLIDDLDPQAERQLCELAKKEAGIDAVFVVGFPLASRPFYTHPREMGGSAGAAQSFDLLFRGLEITTGGQRLHTRGALEQALRRKGMDPASFEQHLRMFDLGMPPHGGLAIGAERLTAQILGLSNVRQTTLYPRDRYHIAP